MEREDAAGRPVQQRRAAALRHGAIAHMTVGLDRVAHPHRTLQILAQRRRRIVIGGYPAARVVCRLRVAGQRGAGVGHFQPIGSEHGCGRSRRGGSRLRDGRGAARLEYMPQVPPQRRRRDEQREGDPDQPSPPVTLARRGIVTIRVPTVKGARTAAIGITHEGRSATLTRERRREGLHGGDTRSSDLSGQRRQRPVDRRLALRLKKRIGLGEGPAAEEAVMRGERRGMRGADHQMAAAPGAVPDERRLLLRIAAPQDEDDRIGLGRDRADHGIGECLPAAILVARGHAHLHRQHRIEQQHALRRPMFEETVRRPRDAEIGIELLEDVDQARWRADAGPDREAQPVRLPLAMIGILAQDHDAHPVERGEIERAEPRAALGEDALARRLLRHEKMLQRRHIRAGEFARERGAPARVEFYARLATAIVRRRLAHATVSAARPTGCACAGAASIARRRRRLAFAQGHARLPAPRYGRLAMGILDGLLGQVADSVDIQNLAAKVGLTPEQVEQAVTALGQAHPQPGDTAQTAAEQTGLPQSTLQEIIGHIGGEGSLGEFASLLQSQGGGILGSLGSMFGSKT